MGIKLLLTLLLLGTIDRTHCCVPQREYSNQLSENPTIVSGRPLTTFLRYKQFHPNVDENSDDASGKKGRPMMRRSKMWKKTMRYYQTSDEVVFQDEEKGKKHGKRTFEDHWMTQRCYAALDRLALSLRMSAPGQDFGVRILVLEAWEPIRRRSKTVRPVSLHHEGRALDLTFYVPRVHRKVWKAESRLGLLAFWAIRAGFDWVHYESRDHIHVSCKPDRPGEMSQIPMRCFPGTATVSMENGDSKLMTDLRIGDRIMAVDSRGEIVASPVLLFLDRSVDVIDRYISLQLADGQKLRLSPDHLIYRMQQSLQSAANRCELACYSNDVRRKMQQNSRNDSASLKLSQAFNCHHPDHGCAHSRHISGATDLWSLAEATRAKNMQTGDFVLRRNSANERMLWIEVVAIDAISDGGAYAPLTAEGTLLVDGVVASCYAATQYETLAHAALAPVRWLSYLTTFEQSEGIHFYAKLLMHIADIVEMLSSYRLYN